MTRRLVAIPFVLAYWVLSMAGAWWHRTELSVAALGVLLIVIALLMLDWRRPITFGIWLLLAAPLLAAVIGGHATLALDALPIVINAALAWMFGHTLGAGGQPLIARMICIIEGPPRLELPGVARYTRQLTVFWTLLLTAQALLLLVLALCVVPGGVLVSLGFASPWPLLQAHVAWYTRIGTYLLPLVAVLGEYIWRRWYLRHISHLSARQFVTQLIACWPQILGHSPRA